MNHTHGKRRVTRGRKTSLSRMAMFTRRSQEIHLLSKRGCRDSSAGPLEDYSMELPGHRGLGNGPAVRGLLALQRREDPNVFFPF